MSNPAVITLGSVNTKVGFFQVEDNIGESIHLHLGEIRCDMTIDELDELAQAAELAVDRFIKAEGFCVNDFGKEFLFTLAETELLPNLIAVEEDKVNLSEMRVDTHYSYGSDKFKHLSESRVFKALNGNTKENDMREEKTFYGQTNQQRVENMLESIKEKGYPANGKMIVLAQDSNKIYDGQHRAACLYYLWGDKEVPVKRMVFKGLHKSKRISTGSCLLYCRSLVILAMNRFGKYKTKIQNTYKIMTDARNQRKDRIKFKDVK